MDDATLIQAFVEGLIQGKPALVSNPNLRTEPVFDAIQLIAKKEGLIATAKLTAQPRSAMVRRETFYWESIHESMVAKNFLPTGEVQTKDFYNYQQHTVPKGYEMHYTDAMQLWRAWWGRKGRSRIGIPMELLILNGGSWSPLREIICSNGSLYIKTLGRDIVIHGSETIVWLKKIVEANLAPQAPQAPTLRGLEPLRGYYKPKLENQEQ